jgi:hypothetical protein
MDLRSITLGDQHRRLTMSLPKAQDRLQPALLDRLRDDDPTHPGTRRKPRAVAQPPA